MQEDTHIDRWEAQRQLATRANENQRRSSGAKGRKAVCAPKQGEETAERHNGKQKRQRADRAEETATASHKKPPRQQRWAVQAVSDGGDSLKARDTGKDRQTLETQPPKSEVVKH